MLRAVRQQAAELWQWTRENGWMLFLATVAAYAQQHYDLYGPPAHLLILPGLAVAVFLVFPLWASVVHDSRDRLAQVLAALGAAAAMAPALVWSYFPGGKDALKADASALVVGGTVGLALVIAAAGRGKVDLGAWGLGPGRIRWWGGPVGLLLLLIAVGIPTTVWLFPEFAQFYPRYKPARTDAVALLQYELAMGVYMFCWEFFFRGFMLFGLARSLGPVAAIVVQCYPFFLLHDNKPEPEMASSWFGGILVGWLCWRAGSMWPSFLLHWIMYASMEVTAFVVRNGL